MAAKRSSPTPETQPTEPTAHQARVSEHIARLEARHRALVEETALELDLLKQQLRDDKLVQEQVAAAREPLLQEIQQMRSRVEQAEKDREQLTGEIQSLHHNYQSRYGELQGAIGSLKNSVRTQGQTLDKQIQHFTEETETAIDDLLQSLQPSAKVSPVTAVAAPAEPLPTVTDDNLEALLAEFSTTPAVAAEKVEPVQLKKEKKEKKPRSWKGLRRFALRTVFAALVLTLGWQGLKVIQKKNLAEAGQVAGVSTTAPSAQTTTGDPTLDHKEVNAILPFDQTEWEPYTDPDFGISMRWPKNTSYLLKTPGASNVWLLRFDSYLVRLTIDTTNDTLEDWWKKNSGFYSSDGSAVKGTFKGQPAWIITSTGQTTAGTTYIFQTKAGILQFWVKEEGPQTDDGLRIAKIVDSLSVAQ